MSLRVRAIIIVVGCTVLGLGAIAAFDRFAVSSQLDEAERVEVHRDVLRVLNAIEVERDALDVLTRDWSSWTDTYDFMESRSGEYLDRNVIPDLVEALEIDAFLIVDELGATVFSQTLSHDGAYEPTPGLSDHDDARRELLRRAMAETAVTGIYRLPDGPMLISARAILRNDESGEPRGFLLMGRWISDEFGARLVRNLATPLTLSIVVGSEIPADLEPLLDGSGRAIARPGDDGYVGYGLAYDLGDEPAFMVRTEQVHNTAELSRQAITLSMIAVGGMGVLLVAAILTGIERWLVQPMVRLRREMEVVGRGAADHVTVEGKDEIARVADGVNVMLDRLSHAVVEQERLTSLASDQQNLAETALSAMSDGLLAFNAKGVCTVCNPAAALLLGVPPAQVVGRSLPDLLPGLSSALAASSDVPQLLEMDGRTVAVSYGTNAGARQMRASVAVLRDITEILNVERLKRDIVATVSHELRTPLTAIRATVDLFDSGDAGDLTDVQQRMVTLLGRNVERLRHIVNDLLDLTSLESGRVHLDLEEVDLVLACQRVVEDLRPAAIAADVTVVVDASDDAIAWADSGRLRQVLENLIQNAVKFSRAGGNVRVTATREAGEVTVRVADEGIGIPPDEREQVFEKFYRTRAASRAAQGTGLGLPIARLIVEMHGGRIRVESDGHRGTTAIFTIPTEPSATAIADQ